MDKLFMDLNANDQFSKLNDCDLQELIKQIESCYLTYRHSLNLPNNLTFGIEIEYERAFKWITDIYVKKYLENWISKIDPTLIIGGEITSPIMVDEAKYWQELKRICDFLTIRRADTCHNAGGHVHIGADILDEDINAWRVFLKLYMTYEHVLFRFGYGDKISGRKKILIYAYPLADCLYNNFLQDINCSQNMDNIRLVIPHDSKFSALNFRNYIDYHSFNLYHKDTLEFRMPNATTNAIIWQNNINAFAKMLLSSKLGNIDEEFLDYKLANEFFTYEGNEYWYNNVCLQNALEFVDLIFDNNLDKMYFLRQYLKNFQENNNLKRTIKAKKFWK